jgi:hypothetical protein
MHIHPWSLQSEVAPTHIVLLCLQIFAFLPSFPVYLPTLVKRYLVQRGPKFLRKGHFWLATTKPVFR